MPIHQFSLEICVPAKFESNIACGIFYDYVEIYYCCKTAGKPHCNTRGSCINTQQCVRVQFFSGNYR